MCVPQLATLVQNHLGEVWWTRRSFPVSLSYLSVPAAAEMQVPAVEGPQMTVSSLNTGRCHRTRAAICCDTQPGSLFFSDKLTEHHRSRTPLSRAERHECS
jgi:hypothetical protein